MRNAVRKQVHFDMRSKLTRFGIDLKAKLVKKDKQRDNTAFKGDSDLRYHIAKRDGSHQSFRQLQSAHAYDPAFYVCPFVFDSYQILRICRSFV